MKKRLEDTRNLIDEYKGLSNEEVFERLEQKRNSLEVAIENVSHDFNAGTIVRNANNFNVSKVHIIGRRKYNRRGAMCTDKYLEVVYWEKVADFVADQRSRGQELVAIENNIGELRDENGDLILDKTGEPLKERPLEEKRFEAKTTLIFGGESDGLTEDILKNCDDIREITNYGSTRSVNVGVASGIAMYEWARQQGSKGLALED